MRRSDREIKNRQEIIEVLNRCDIVRLGINTPDYPYIIPMGFGMESEGDFLTLWFHCAHEGRKLDLIKQNPRVGFEADCSHKLIEGEKASNYTMEYESVIGCGNIEICHDKDTKLRGMKAIMGKYAPSKTFEFSEQEINSICVLRLDIKQISGKQLKKY